MLRADFCSSVKALLKDPPFSYKIPPIFLLLEWSYKWIVSDSIDFIISRSKDSHEHFPFCHRHKDILRKCANIKLEYLLLSDFPPSEDLREIFELTGREFVSDCLRIVLESVLELTGDFASEFSLCCAFSIWQWLLLQNNKQIQWAFTSSNLVDKHRKADKKGSHFYSIKLYMSFTSNVKLRWH